MHQQHKMEIKFDGILKQAVPLILFSYEKYRKPLLEKVSKLYEAFDANDTDVFDGLFNQILDMIDDDNREMFDSNKERLIESFVNRNRTYEERLLDHDNKLMGLKKEVSLLRRKRLSKKTSKKHLAEKLMEGKPKRKGISVTCAGCGYEWIFTGKGKIARCGKCDKANRIR